jgi:hypothetical protein
VAARLTGSVNYGKIHAKEKISKRSKRSLWRKFQELSGKTGNKPHRIGKNNPVKGVKGTPYEKPLFGLFLPELR